MFFDLLSMSTAEDEDLLHSRGSQELDGVVEQWDVHDRQQGLQTKD